jgi:plastocyanin
MKGLLIVIAIAIVVFLGYKVVKSNSGNSGSYGSVATNNTPSPEMTGAAGTITPVNNSSVVQITQAGFVPDVVTIKTGETVVWQNPDGVSATVNSDVHPTHLLYPPLNLGEVPPQGGQVSLKFDKAGTFTYHNHLNPSQTGTVVVQ